MSEAFGNLFSKGLSYFNRHYRNEEHSIVPEVQTGEYKINYNGYSKPAVSIKHKSADKFNSTLQAVDYDPNTFIFGTRNRGEYPNDADNVTLTTFNPFVDKNNPVLKKYHSFIGISSDGKLKVSTNLNDFVGEGWKISPTYSNIITGFRRNEDGSLYLDKDYLKGTKTPDNPKHRIVWFNGIDDNGNTFDNGQLNVLTPVQDKNGNFATNYYGDIAGGKALFATDDGQMRLLSGSIEQIVAGFEEFLRSNPGKQIRMYTLDNGAYSKLLKKNKGYFTREDWNKYDNQHFGGGNVAYIKGNAVLQLQFPSDTAYTLINNPSYTGIAKPNDTQVKKGHPITREPQGIVLHQTATRMSAPNSEVLRAFQQNGTGANVVIGTRGQRTVLAPPDRVTYHAGYSAYQDGNTLLENLNDYFSGIEFVGEKRDLITDAQVQSAIEYLRPIIQQYKIYPNKLVTHELVRNAYNKLHNNSAPNKWDMNYKSYEKLMRAILNEIYYLKRGGKLIKKCLNGGKPYQLSLLYNKTYDDHFFTPRAGLPSQTIPSSFVPSYQNQTTIPYTINNDKDWLKYWYKNRQKQLRNISWYPYFDDENLNEYVENSGEDYLTAATKARILALYDAIDYAYSLPVNYTNLGYGTLGLFNSNSKEIKIDPNQSDYSTNLHEHVHKLNDKIYNYDLIFSNDGIHKISPIEKLIKDVYNKQHFDTYLDAPYEIYSRLMEFRRMNNLDPGLIYKKEDIQEWRKNGSLEKYELDRYSDDLLLYLFNEVADNTKLDEEINYSKRGSKLIKR